MIRSASPSNKEVVRRLMTAAGPGLGGSAGEVADYDWTRPHGFAPWQLRQLEDCAAQLALAVAGSLAKLRLELELNALPVQESFGSALKAACAQQRPFCLPLELDASPCGLIVVPATEAIGWVAKLLGAKADQAERELSALESALLNDAFCAVASGFQSVLTAGGKLKTGQTPLRELPFEVSDDQEFCHIELSGPNGLAASVILAAQAADVLLLGATGGAQTPSKQAEAELLGHVQKAAVRATVILGVATVSMGDVAALEAGDVLLLPTAIGQPLDLRVHEMIVARGVPAQSQGCYAVQIVQTA